MEYAIVIRRGLNETSYDVILTDDYEKAIEFVKTQYDNYYQELCQLEDEIKMYSTYYSEDHCYLEWRWVVRRSIDAIDIEIVETDYLNDINDNYSITSIM